MNRKTFMPQRYSISGSHKILLVSLLLVFLWSSIRPFDRFTWFLEMLPVAIAVPILLLTYRRFRLTNLAYLLIFIHAVILLIGAKYTYAREPLFDWLRELFGWTRNNYDRVGHFAQGFVPAILAREILLRKTALRPGGMLFFLVLCVCMFISSTFELFEWSVAISTGAKADDYLAFQGDVWDTQKDMAMCFVGAIIALLTLSRSHDRQLSILPDARQ
jgi:putative membrane protein